MYRKFKAPFIFDGETLQQGKILVTTENGMIESLEDEMNVSGDIETVDGIISPGFINCHCHLELSHLKGKIPLHTGLVEFVQHVMLHRGAAPEMKYQAMADAAKEMYDGGIVAVGDICNTTDTIKLKSDSPVYWHNFVEVSGFVEGSAEKRLSEMTAVAEAFGDMRTSIVPHAPYSVSKKLFSLINTRTSGEIISIHNQEDEAENELFLRGAGNLLLLYKNLGIDISDFHPTGDTSFKTWQHYFTHGQRIISVHNTFTTKDEIRTAKQVTFCICINANLYINNKVPPVNELLLSDNIVLGTDSYASNMQLSILEEMKQIQKHFPEIGNATLLKWATSNGARALGIEERFGAFRHGTIPGIIAISNFDNDLDGADCRRLI